jgi:hypothetical protein
MTVMRHCVFLIHGKCINAAVSIAPSKEVCDRCAHYIGSPRGLGDVVHSVATTLRVDRVVDAIAGDCGCAQRRAALNAALPFTDEAPKEG